MGETMPRAAFFDFDNTLILGDSQELEIKYFRSKGKISSVELARISAVYILYKLGLASKAALVRACIHAYRGMTPLELKRHGPVFFEEVVRPLLVPEMIRRLEGHREQNDLVAILTATPPHLVLPAAEALNVSHIISTRIEMGDDGLLTGRTAGEVCMGARKREAAANLAARYDIDLGRSWAYSDDQADLPFLELVGNPVAVNPTLKLKRIATKRGWEVVDVPGTV
jgi:HAD superfamily hydrolase (TIGR01490 family)